MRRLSNLAECALRPLWRVEDKHQNSRSHRTRAAVDIEASAEAAKGRIDRRALDQFTGEWPRVRVFRGSEKRTWAESVLHVRQ
jgi:hypothetical protein